MDGIGSIRWGWEWKDKAGMDRTGVNWSAPLDGMEGQLGRGVEGKRWGKQRSGIGRQGVATGVARKWTWRAEAGFRRGQDWQAGMDGSGWDKGRKGKVSIEPSGTGKAGLTSPREKRINEKGWVRSPTGKILASFPS